jgi:hypothetical protein
MEGRECPANVTARFPNVDPIARKPIVIGKFRRMMPRAVNATCHPHS